MQEGIPEAVLSLAVVPCAYLCFMITASLYLAGSHEPA